VTKKFNLFWFATQQWADAYVAEGCAASVPYRE